MTKLQRPVVCAIVVRDQRILLQRRSKLTDDTPYNGFWELPQGKIERGESLQAAAERELLEETGLQYSGMIGSGEHLTVGTNDTSTIFVSFPMVCVIDTQQGHLGIPVLLRAEGEPRATKEASLHRWFAPKEINDLIADGAIFPLNIPMLSACLLPPSPEGVIEWAF